MNHGFVVTRKDTLHPLKDVFLPIRRRPGYIEGNQPVVPVYCFRQMGIEAGDPQLFYNHLYELDIQLQGQSGGYVRIEGSLDMPTHEEVESLLRNMAPITNSPKEQILSHFCHPSQLKRFADITWHSNIHTALKELIQFYLTNEPHGNPSKLQNLVVKIMAWLQRVAPIVLVKPMSDHCPKVLFCGDIKAHEVYFLFFLSFIGMDVIYVHTEKAKENPFFLIDPQGIHMNRIELPQSATLNEFPETDKRVRKTAVAFEASKEIDQMLYGEDVGVYKAWQYKEASTQPITLKTTHDELKILWQEEAKVRPEFKVQQNKVYVPNIFAKVNGTYPVVEEYWEEIYELSEAPHTVLYKEVHFAKVTYSRQELYSMAFLFDEAGFIIPEKLMAHPSYKFQFLKEPLQRFLIAKLNELIASEMFLQEMDLDFKLRIIMTVITMEEALLRLLESFDYAGKVPKIIIYDSKRENFSVKDIALLAFFNVVGMDIVIYTPTNYNNIEQWIKKDYFDLHQLPSVTFDMALPEQRPQKKKRGLLQSLFGRK